MSIASVTAEDSVYALLTDGTTAEIRPAAPGDVAAVTAMHEAMSPDNSYLRFFNFSRLSAEQEAERVCRAPATDHMALLAFVGGQVVGVASYEVKSGTTEAEVALAVADQMHGRGVGTLLLEHLVSVAGRWGLSTFTAYGPEAERRNAAGSHRCRACGPARAGGWPDRVRLRAAR